MAITSSAKKALRTSRTKRVFNVRRKEAVNKVVRDIKKAVSINKIDEAKKMLSLAYKKFDKAVKMDTINAGNANRRKSRLSAMIKKADVKK